MAISTTASEVRYIGSGVAGPFSIPYQFLDKAHIKAALKDDADADPVVLGPSSYTVTRNSSTMLGSLTLAFTIASPKVLVIYRETPKTQPTVLPTSGALPSKSVETGMDRAVLIAQELQRQMEADSEAPTSEGDAFKGVLVSENLPNEVPAYLGQVGVSPFEKKVWLATQEGVFGAWVEFGNTWKANEVLRFGFVSDAGNPGTQQNAVVSQLGALGLADLPVFFGGNNTQNGPSNYDADWAAFASWISAQAAYPTLGNMELDDITPIAGMLPGYITRHRTKFSYLPKTGAYADVNSLYYKLTLGEDLVEVYVLDCATNSVGNRPAPPNTPANQEAFTGLLLSASKARWRVLVTHLPPITSASSDILASHVSNFEEYANYFHLVLCGHQKLLEVLRWGNAMVANVSSSVSTAGTVNHTAAGPVVTPTGAFSLTPTDAVLWTNDTENAVARLLATPDYLRLEIWSTDGRLLHARNVDDFSVRSGAPGVVDALDAATVTLYCDAAKPSQLHKVSLGGNRTLAFSGVTTGMQGTLFVKQDATGSRTLTLPAGSKVSGGGSGAVTLTTTANAVDTLTWFYDGTNFFWQKAANFT